MTDNGWSLRTALGIGRLSELIAFVGGGGKTSLMFALAAELSGHTVMTTTTRIFAAQIRLAPAVAYADDLSNLDDLLATHGRCLVVGHVEGEKALGVDPDLPARLLGRPDVDFVLVEADGSRMRPVKAPAEHEPVIPPATTLLVPIAGIDALEGVIEKVAHRPDTLRAITNEEWGMGNGGAGDNRLPLVVDGHLTPAGLARVLAHPHGGLKGAPVGARVIPFLNKVETAERLAAAREAAGALLVEPRISRVVLGALHEERPVREVWRRVTAVVLAAGESKRMGRNKLLLPWGNSTVLGRTIRNVRASSVSDIRLITGHERNLVEAWANTAGITTAYNPYYANGMLSSVQAGVRLLPATTEAALIVLGDQPMVEPAAIDQLLEAYYANPKGLVAPFFQGRRGNPVLIDRRHFAELLSLPPDAAPRELLQHHPDDLLKIEMDSDTILHDIDRPEEYERWRPVE